MNTMYNNQNPAQSKEPIGINRVVLSDQVKQIILDKIESGEFLPGDRLVESQLAGQLGISQAPVREAICDLVSAGFLDRKPHKGAIVRMLSDDDMNEIYAVRAPLDALAAEQVAPHITDDQIQSLAEIIEKMVEMAVANDFFQAARLDWQFHTLIIDMSGIKLLRRMYDSMQVSQYILVTMRRSPLSLKTLASRHQAIIDALQTRDPEMARQAMQAHFEGLRPIPQGMELTNSNMAR
ncbi:MAG TPA: GntR family transcriptional regulator [Anaerolineales bacterium]|nr:GntR family transcriptional regulator [Anaerolineales bacterium]